MEDVRPYLGSHVGNHGEARRVIAEAHPGYLLEGGEGGGEF